jgi:hypothetical protein
MNRTAWPPTDSSDAVSAHARRRDLLAIAVIVAIAPAVMLALPKGPTHVGSITVDNPTPYELHLAVVDPDGSTTPLGIVAPADQSTLAEVVDSGANWTIRASSQGASAPDFDVDGRHAGGAGWVLAIPPSVADDLAAQGVGPVPYLADAGR